MRIIGIRLIILDYESDYFFKLELRITAVIILLSQEQCFSWTEIILLNYSFHYPYRYLSAFSQLGFFISMIAIRISQRFSTEMWLVMIGVISNMSGFVVLAFSQLAWNIILGKWAFLFQAEATFFYLFTWLNFIQWILTCICRTKWITLCMCLHAGLCLNMLGYVIIPVIRSQVSKTVEEHEVGSIFALLACAQSFAMFIAAFIFNSIFSATVNSEYPGVVFIAGVALYVVFIPLYW